MVVTYSKLAAEKVVVSLSRRRGTNPDATLPLTAPSKGCLAQVPKQCRLPYVFHKKRHPKYKQQRALLVHQRKTEHFIAKAFFATFHTSTHLFDTCD